MMFYDVFSINDLRENIFILYMKKIEKVVN